MANGLIFDLRRFSIHDGPGIRTTVFFKGCPLNCAWCHNPESQSFAPELMLLPNRCVDCGACAATCPHGAIWKMGDHWVTDRGICRVCGDCVAVCYADGRQIVGREYSLDELMETIMSDEAFYAQSGGGVTFSGGEPLAQPEALKALLQACKARGYHNALDTCGHAPWSAFEEVLPLLDLVLYDLKLLDPEKHRQYTGVSNELILENLEKLAKTGKELWLRIPIIPGVNDSPDDLAASAAFIRGLDGNPRVFILPYHDVASSKYPNIGADQRLGKIAPADQEAMDRAAAYFLERGLPVQQGG